MTALSVVITTPGLALARGAGGKQSPADEGWPERAKNDQPVERGAGRRFHDDDRRAALHAPPGRLRRRGDQARSPGWRRYDALPPAAAGRRRPLLWPAQHGQKKR